MTKRSTRKALEWSYTENDGITWEEIENALTEEREDANEDTKEI